MIAEKLEWCPKCGEGGKRWHYDFQRCGSCGHDRMNLGFAKTKRTPEQQERVDQNEMLVVKPNGSGQYYKILDGPKWWTAKLEDDGRWFLMDGVLRVVSPDGVIGKKVVKAIEDFEMKSDPQSPYNP